MKDRKPEILLIVSAVVVIMTATVYSIFDSPKYNNLQIPEPVSTTAAVTEKHDLININTADASELMKLKNIGEVRAAAIIEYRETNGSFRTVEELTNVSGITQSIVEENADIITV